MALRSFSDQKWALVLLALLWVGCSTPADIELGVLDRLAESVRAEVEAPGVILGVRLADGEPRIGAAGLADLASSRPIKAEDAVFLGSVSKLHTAVTVLRLVEEGRLSLDDPLSRFLPDFPRATEITVQQLLGHTTGLKDFYSYLYFRPDREEMIDLVTRDWTESELLELAGRFGHWFEPGEDWSYSNTNYYLLGVVVERVSGLSLPEAYRGYIYEPLGLERTWLTYHEPPRRDLPVTGYMGPVEGWEHSEMFGELGPTTRLDRSPVEWGAGGLAAPSADALEFLAALMSGRLLGEEMLSVLKDVRPTPPLGAASAGLNPDVFNGYGAGLVRMEREGYIVEGHGGLFTGHTAGLWHLPACGVTLFLFINRGFAGQRVALDRVIEELVETAAIPGSCVSEGATDPPG